MADNTPKSSPSSFDDLLGRGHAWFEGQLGRSRQEQGPSPASPVTSETFVPARTSGTGAPQSKAAAAPAPRQSPPQTVVQTGARASTPPAQPNRAGLPAELDLAGSSAAKKLTGRFGDGWTFEVVDQKIDGGEVVVLGKLSIPGQGISKTQFGRAHMSSGGSQAVAPSGGASVGGVPFSVGGISGSIAGGAAPARGGDPQAAAYQSAMEKALAKCFDLL